jgi:purine nucleosidase
MQMRYCILLLLACLAFPQAVSPIRPTPSLQSQRRIILDTDPGIDDALAVLLALRSPELKVEAITTVAGNVPVDLGAENTLKLVELAGRTDVPVARGAARPLKRKPSTAELIHGANGLGGVVLPRPTKKLDPRTAVEVIHDVVTTNPGAITLLTVGPLTNVATAFVRYPNLASNVREIILVGGTTGSGLATPVAEPNVYMDAEAAKIVFESGVPILMVDLTASAQARWTRDDVARLRESENSVARFIAAISEPYLQFSEKFGPGGAAIYDALGVGIAIDGRIAKTTKPVHVDVEIKGEFTYGATVTNPVLARARFHPHEDRLVFAGFEPVRANAAYPVTVDSERFIRLLTERLMSAAPAKQ